MPTKRINRQIDLAKGLVIFTELASKETVTANIMDLVGGEAVYVKLPETAKRMLCHGANAKYGDSAADPKLPAIPQIAATIAQVIAGTWNSKGTGTGPRMSIQVLATFEVACAKAKKNGKDAPTLDQISDILDKLTAEKKKAVFASAEIVAAKTRIESERKAEKAKVAAEAAKGADTDLDALLA